MAGTAIGLLSANGYVVEPVQTTNDLSVLRIAEYRPNIKERPALKVRITSREHNEIPAFEIELLPAEEWIPPYQLGVAEAPFSSRLPVKGPSQDSVEGLGKMISLVGTSGSQVEAIRFPDEPYLPPFNILKEMALQESGIRAGQTEEPIRPSGDYVDHCFQPSLVVRIPTI